MMGMGFNSKKELKDKTREGKVTSSNLIETSMFGNEYKGDGTYCVVGPDPYTKRKWYARVTFANDICIGVK